MPENDLASRAAGVAHATKQRARNQFDGWAAGYDRSLLQFFLFQPSYRLLMAELAALARVRGPGLRVLDVGCGTGQFCTLALRSGLCQFALGVDYAEPMVRAARHRAAVVLPPEQVRQVQFAHADGEHLPVADRSIDFLACANSFHHYPHQDHAVREFARVLKPGGRVAVIDGSRDSLLGYFVFEVCVNYFEGGVHHCRHTDMEDLFTHAGLNLVKQFKHHVWCPILLTVGEQPLGEADRPASGGHPATGGEVPT